MLLKEKAGAWAMYKQKQHFWREFSNSITIATHGKIEGAITTFCSGCWLPCFLAFNGNLMAMSTPSRRFVGVTTWRHKLSALSKGWHLSTCEKSQPYLSADLRKSTIWSTTYIPPSTIVRPFKISRSCLLPYGGYSRGRGGPTPPKIFG